MRVSPILRTEKNAPDYSPNPNFPCPHFGFGEKNPSRHVSKMHVHLSFFASSALEKAFHAGYSTALLFALNGFM